MLLDIALAAVSTWPEQSDPGPWGMSCSSCPFTVFIISLVHTAVLAPSVDLFVDAGWTLHRNGVLTVLCDSLSWKTSFPVSLTEMLLPLLVSVSVLSVLCSVLKEAGKFCLVPCWHLFLPFPSWQISNLGALLRKVWGMLSGPGYLASFTQS